MFAGPLSLRCARKGLKLYVQPSREDRDRSPVHVEGRIEEELVITSQNHPLAKGVSIVSLDDLLAAVGECAVADQEPKAACRDAVPIRN
jgi:hypothetical protein